MIAVDTNVLVYAHRSEYALHERARDLIKQLAESGARWAIPWPCVHEFYAIVTHHRIHRPPTPPDRAWVQIDAWRAAPTLSLLAEAPDHADRLRQLTVGGDIVGGQVHDARIAALCLSHGVSELITMDRDFTRFPALRTRSLLA